MSHMFCAWRYQWNIQHMINATRKPVFGVCDQLRLKPACSADKTSYGLESAAIASRGIILSKQRTTKADLRLWCSHMAYSGFLMMWLIYPASTKRRESKASRWSTAVTILTEGVGMQIKWASSWDYGSYHIGDQRRLRRACASAQSRQSLRCSHTWTMEIDEGSDQNSDI